MIPMGMDENWKRVRFKGNKVWMAVDGEDRPLIEKGKALIKYQLDQPHQYWVHPAGIRPLDEDPAERDTTAPPHPPKKSGGSGRRRSPISKDAVGAADVPDSLKQDAISIYTDGACSGNPGPAGIGVVMYYKGHRKEISRYIGLATNNIAELEAIKTGLEAVRNRSLPVLLYTDSSYSLGLLTRGWKAKQNQELVKKVRELVKAFKSLQIIKIKGHAGHPENERADRLAVAAIKENA
jgi:ribonuclease HI